MLIRALMSEIGALAKAKGFPESRVLSKVNARGELVIGLLIPERTPGEWRAGEVDEREAKRLERMKRS
jgi:hypothetical protein